MYWQAKKLVTQRIGDENLLICNAFDLFEVCELASRWVALFQVYHKCMYQGECYGECCWTQRRPVNQT